MRGNKLFVMRLTTKHGKRCLEWMDTYMQRKPIIPIFNWKNNYSRAKLDFTTPLTLLRVLWCIYLLHNRNTPYIFFATRGVLLLSQVRMIIICFNSRYANALGRHSSGLSRAGRKIKHICS